MLAGLTAAFVAADVSAPAARRADQRDRGACQVGHSQRWPLACRSGEVRHV